MWARWKRSRIESRLKLVGAFVPAGSRLTASGKLLVDTRALRLFHVESRTGLW